VPLGAGRKDHRVLMDMDGKVDAVDASRMHLRGSRFSDSYMMATNGGSTYENVLRGYQPATASAPTRPVADRRRPNPDGTSPILQNVHGQTDDRVLIADTKAIPVRSIGLLKITTATFAERYGTAWLIGPRAFATAAHNLLDPRDGPARELHIGVAYDGTRAVYGWHKVTDNRLPQLWVDDPGSHNTSDYAVLQIENPDVGNSLGWFGFADYEDAKFANLAVNLIGYPMDDNLQRFHMYGAKGRTLGSDRFRVYYDCDAGGGVSGGPLIALFGEHRIVVGVHVAGGTTSNVATRIAGATHDMFQEFKAW
jgi:V8-like Glu-specific endopeptidase